MCAYGENVRGKQRHDSDICERESDSTSTSIDLDTPPETVMDWIDRQREREAHRRVCLLYTGVCTYVYIDIHM